MDIQVNISNVRGPEEEALVKRILGDLEKASITDKRPTRSEVISGGHALSERLQVEGRGLREAESFKAVEVFNIQAPQWDEQAHREKVEAQIAKEQKEFEASGGGGYMPSYMKNTRAYEERNATTEAEAAVVTSEENPTATTDETAVEVEVDSAGLPWDERINPGSKTKTKNGRWKKKPKLDPAVYEAVTAELNGGEAVKAPEKPKTHEDLKALMGELNSGLLKAGFDAFDAATLIADALRSFSDGTVEFSNVYAVPVGCIKQLFDNLPAKVEEFGGVADKAPQ